MGDSMFWLLNDLELLFSLTTRMIYDLMNVQNREKKKCCLDVHLKYHNVCTYDSSYVSGPTLRTISVVDFCLDRRRL